MATAATVTALDVPMQHRFGQDLTAEAVGGARHEHRCPAEVGDVLGGAVSG